MDGNKKMIDEKSHRSLDVAHEDLASPRFDSRPWGSFTVLDEGSGFKVKRLEVLPGKRLSYQYHDHRHEHWVVVKGRATVTLDGIQSIVDEGETVDVPVATRHRIENAGSERLVLIEVQRGSYLGEDDIVRLEDDFERI
jgi:mannose-6-phosphate isomerase-like protein (cupin superfamily)